MARPRPRRFSVTALLTVLVAAAALLGACGLPRGSTPVQIPPDDVPYGLLATPTTGPTPTAPPGVLMVPGTIYLADAQQKLVPVGVQVPAASAAPLLQGLLNRLAVGPSDRERARGLITDLGPASTIVVRSISSGTASIDLQSISQDPSASKLPVAVGQIVLTATSVVGVDRVVFVRGGTVLPVPGPDGSTTADALVASDYVGMVAPGQPPVDRTVPLPPLPTPATTTTTTEP
ncbi:MAG TPA: GerMN domain-containing protein [Lapillicoccus sp.]|uniref:GerMN domain-containing protein n=1 Tax=Lapillicoccus sp. TaxID=1909287 RepID=UPI002F9597D9